jgi:hypothetical protein
MGCDCQAAADAVRSRLDAYKRLYYIYECKYAQSSCTAIVFAVSNDSPTSQARLITQSLQFASNNTAGDQK